MPKVSVVIPVYNAEAFLKSSLDSVLSQSIGDLEVLCTDDGSQDSSRAILLEYSEKDPRVRVFCQENKGAGPARNLALSNARGEYVVFMDGDDNYPEKDTLEKLYNAAKEKNCDIVAGYRSMLTEEGIHVDIHDPLYKLAQEHPQGAVLSYKEVQFDFNYQCYFFRHSLIRENNITFPDFRRCQDPPFLVRAMIAAGEFYLLPISSYLYRWGHQNIRWDKRKINDLLKAHIDLLGLSREAELDKLHRTVASRVERKYKNIILSCLNGENLDLVALLVYANSITDFVWLESKGDKKRKTPWFASVAELIAKLPNVLTLTAGVSGKTLTEMVEEIYDCYRSLPDADVSFLNDVMLCVLAQLYDLRRPAYIRKQLYAFVSGSRYCDICANSSGAGEAAAAREKLESMLPGFEYCEKLQMLKEEQNHNCTCLFDSRTNSNPKVSVIVPVYNVESYLEDCLNSLINQSTKELEIICVNDGSTDASLDIVMRYAQNNPNFIVLNQVNSGLSAARNSGLRYATGTYVHFLDSDDFMDLNAYEQLLNKAEQHDLDLLFFDGKSYYEDENLRREFPWYEHGYESKSAGDGIVDGETYFINAVLEADYRISACMYLVRRQFLEENQIRFLEGIVHEDNYFTYVCTLLSAKTSHLTAPLYGRRVVRGSITIRDKKFRHAYGYFRSYLELRAFMARTSLSSGLADIMSLKLMDMLKNARNEYEKITDPLEQQYYLALPSAESEQFYLMVVDPIQQIRERSRQAVARMTPRKQNTAAPKAVAVIPEKHGNIFARGWQCVKDHGLFYTIGYSFRKAGKKLHGGVQCVKDHGFAYTVKYGLQKVLRRLR